MFVKSSIVLAGLVAFAQARFGQENAAQNAIAALGGGEAATLGGQSISTLLAGSNACDKLSLADQVAALDLPGALDAAKVLVQAEKNFNPFAVDRPSICSDANLPATEGLRGIIPLIDPAVPGADAVNAASAASLNNPVNANGKSVADLLVDIGFTTFTAQGSDGSNVDVGAGNGGNDNVNNDNNNNNNDNNNGGNDNVEEVVEEVEEVVDEQPEVVDVVAGNGNLQSFTGALGGIAAEPIEFSGNNARPFQVAGATFTNFAAAATRTCDRQFNACANLANGGSDEVSVADCSAQKEQCAAAQSSAAVTSFDQVGAAPAPVVTAAPTATEAAVEAGATVTVTQTVSAAQACQTIKIVKVRGNSIRGGRTVHRRELAIKSKREATIKAILAKREELAALEKALIDL